MIVLSREVTRVIYVELVQGMKTVLGKVRPQITQEGYRNAESSKQYLCKQHAKPNHVLQNLARSMGVTNTTPEQLEKLYQEKKSTNYSELFQLFELQDQIDMEKWAGTMVKGRKSYDLSEQSFPSFVLAERQSSQPDPALETRIQGSEIHERRNLRSSTIQSPGLPEKSNVRSTTTGKESWQSRELLNQGQDTDDGFDYLFNPPTTSPKPSQIHPRE